MKTNTFLFHDEEFSNWNLGATHPTQGRRYTNALQMFDSMSRYPRLNCEKPPVKPANRADLLRVHSPEYVAEVLDQFCVFGEFDPRPDQAHIAALFAGASVLGVHSLLGGEALTAINFAGAKHHAQFDHASGFCVFNDFAICADIATKDHGLKVAIFDFDAHHGDGTENLTRDNSQVLTYSVHEGGIFPGTGKVSYPEDHVFNRSLRAGDGDTELLEATAEFIELAEEFRADIIFIAAGADGHESDPLSYLQYTEGIYHEVAALLRDAFPSTPMLIGGAGGYQPDSFTPQIWANFTVAIAGLAERKLPKNWRWRSQPCVICGAKASMREYLFGMPVGPVNDDKYVIGGCCLDGNEPEIKCRECGWEGAKVDLYQALPLSRHTTANTK